MLIGKATRYLDPPLSVDRFLANRKQEERFAVLADAGVDRQGMLVEGDVLAVSRTYDGALRAARHLGPLNLRIAIRRVE